MPMSVACELLLFPQSTQSRFTFSCERFSESDYTLKFHMPIQQRGVDFLEIILWARNG